MACSDQINTTDLENAKVDAITLAEVANSRAGGLAGGALIDSTSTRFLEPVSTLRGQLTKLGYEVPIAYTAGISFTVDDGAKTVDEGGIIYAPRIDALPLTTTGTWATDSASFYVVQDAVGLSNYIVETYAELDAIPAQVTGNVVTVTGEGIAGDWEVKDGAHTANVGTIRDFTNASGDQYLRRIIPTPTLSSWFLEDIELMFSINPLFVVLTNGETYNRTTTLDVTSPCDINLNGSTVSGITDGVYITGFNVISDYVTIRNGSIFIQEAQSGYPGQSTNLGACVNIGTKGTTLNAYSNFKLLDLTLNANRENGGGHITAWGGANNGEIRNIKFTGNAKQVGALINIEWSGNGVDTTWHPNNIKISNIKASGYESMASYASVVRVSGGYNIEVDNIDADRVGSLLSFVAGDYANVRSPAEEVDKIMKGITCKNITGTLLHGRGLYIVGKSGLSTDFLESNIEIDNISATGVDGVAQEFARVEHGRGVKVNRFNASLFDSGINTLFSAQGNSYTNGTLSELRLSAAEFNDDGVNIVESCSLNNVKIKNTNKDIAAGSTGAMVQLLNCKNITVDDCEFGAVGETENGTYSVFLSPANAVNCKVKNNHTNNTSTNNDMYIGPSANGDENALIVNNTAEPGITNFGGVSWTQISGIRTRFGDAIPTVGTHNIGDTIIGKTVTTTWRCTVAGTPGTWVAV